VERLALLAAAAALARTAPNVAALFARTRLARFRGIGFGTAEIDDDDVAVLLGRALP
jgi:hypothetical protein